MATDHRQAAHAGQSRTIVKVGHSFPEDGLQDRETYRSMEGHSVRRLERKKADKSFVGHNGLSRNTQLDVVVGEQWLHGYLHLTQRVTLPRRHANGTVKMNMRAHDQHQEAGAVVSP